MPTRAPAAAPGGGAPRRSSGGTSGCGRGSARSGARGGGPRAGDPPVPALLVLHFRRLASPVLDHLLRFHRDRRPRLPVVLVHEVLKRSLIFSPLTK